MTPKEKAKELVNDVNEELRWCIQDELDSVEYSKTCALFTCNEMLKDSTVHNIGDCDSQISRNLHCEYWENVKTEIKKIVYCS